LKRVIVNILKYGISAGIIGWLVYQARQDPHFAELVSGRKDWSLLAAAWVLCLAAVVLTIVRWYYLVRALSLPFTLRDAFRLGFLGYLLNFVSVGSVGGDLFKAVFIAREQPGRRPEAVATVFIDRLIGLFAMFLLASITLLLTGQLHSSVAEIRVISRCTLLATLVGALGILMVLTPGFTNGAFSEFLGRIPKAGPILQKLIGAVRIYRRKPGVLLLALGMSIAVHSLVAVGIWLIARGLPGAAPGLTTNLVAVPLALVTGVLPLPMSGLGAFEAAVEFLYTRLPSDVVVLAGKGLVVALAYRVITVLIAIVGVIYYLNSRREVAETLHDAEGADDASGPLEAIAAR
jgi:glycosyltransferase 2 family protein